MTGDRLDEGQHREEAGDRPEGLITRGRASATRSDSMTVIASNTEAIACDHGPGWAIPSTAKTALIAPAQAEALASLRPSAW